MYGDLVLIYKFITFVNQYLNFANNNTMIRSVNFEIKGQQLTNDAPFGELIGAKGSTQQFDDVTNNYLAFMIRGSLRVTDCRGNVTVMKADHMYAFSIVAAPYSAEALEDYQCLVLLSSSLRHLINAENAKRVLESKYSIYGVSELPYNDVMKLFVENLLLLKNNNNLVGDLNAIKKVELMHYMRLLYSREELAKFAYGLFATYSDFKMGVFRAYNNGISVQDLADRLFMSTKTLTRRFRDEFQTTPLEWIMEQKLYNLDHLIMNKGYNASQILEEFHFSSYSALRQFCKRNEVEHLLEIMSMRQDKSEI